MRGSSYTFDFGPNDLVNMVGLSVRESGDLIRKLFENKKLRLIDNRIFAADIEEIKKQAEYFKKMQQIEKARKERNQPL